MLNLKQYKIWHSVFREDPELADRVLREYQKRIRSLPSPDEALEAITAADATVPKGFPTREETLVAQLIALKGGK